VVEWPAFPPSSLDEPPLSIDAAMKLLAALGVSMVQIFSAGLEACTRADRADELGTVVQQLAIELQEPAFLVDRDGKAHPANGRARAEILEGGAALEEDLARSDDPARYAVLPLLDDQRLVIRRGEDPARHSLQAARREARALRRVLGLLPMPLVVLDTAGALVCASLGAERLIAERPDLEVRDGMLTSSRRDAAASIAAAVKAVALVANVPATAGTPIGPAPVVDLSPTTEQALGLDFLPLHAQSGDEDLGGVEGRVLVVLHDPAARVRLSPVLLAQLYGLTPMEAATAAAIAEGSSPSDIARARGCADDTVRSHLKRILEKTGTHRQADLVRALLSGAAMQLSRLA